MANLSNIAAGKITFTNSDSELLPSGALTGTQNLILTVEGDSINVWYNITTGTVNTSSKFTGTVHYRVGT